MPSDCPNVLKEESDAKRIRTTSDRFVRHFISGAIAGAISRTATAPFDRIKVFCQVSKTQQHMFHLLLYMIKEGGVRSLWRGNMINVLKTTPKSSIRFAFYDYLKLHMKIDKKDLVLRERVIAGSVAGFISQTICFPLEVLKTRMALSTTGQYNGITHAIITIYRTEGLKSFGRGYVPTLIAIIPHSGLDLAGYETLKVFLTDFKGNPSLNHFELFILSSISCMMGQIVTYPLALVCTRMQASGVLSPGVKMTTRQMFKDIIKYEGFTGLYRGLIPNMIKFIPVVGITFVTYEYINTKLGVTMT